MHCHLLKQVATSVLACLTCSYTAGESWVVHNTYNVSGESCSEQRGGSKLGRGGSKLGREKSSITTNSL